MRRTVSDIWEMTFGTLNLGVHRKIRKCAPKASRRVLVRIFYALPPGDTAAYMSESHSTPSPKKDPIKVFQPILRKYQP